MPCLDLEWWDPFEGTMIGSHSLLGLSLQHMGCSVWNFEMGPPMRGHDDVVTSAAFSPDGARLQTTRQCYAT
jgi:hypothetical protein